jgi:hypothetical protein
MQKKGMERQRRLMIAFGLAAAQERCYWLGGAWSFATLGLLTSVIRKKPLHSIAIAPYIGGTAFLAYNLDFAFGGKPNRINEMSKKILADESYWFVPIEVDPDAPAEKKSK